MISIEQFEKELDLIIKNGYREDVGDGDHTSLSCIPLPAQGKAILLVKDTGIIAGVAFAKKAFKYFDEDLYVESFIDDGSHVTHGDVVFQVSGKSQSILKAERFVLNAMQRMSAIATKTNFFVSLLKGTKTQILDTRKTTPGIRALEKWAVKIGGGVNHRFALYDMIMIKDNHIDFAGGISQAITKTKQYLSDNKLDLKIIVEARNLQEIEEILKNEGIYRILIDNFCKLHYIEDIKITMHSCPVFSTHKYILETITFVLDDTEKSNNRKIKFYEHFSDFYRNKNYDKK